MQLQKIHLSIILAIATLITVSILVFALLSAGQRIPNSGTIKTVRVGVYWDSLCTNNVTSINWELLEPGARPNKTIYIKNSGSTRVILNMTTDNWNTASASRYITLSWNREGYMLDSGASVQTALTLSISQSISEVTNFSFNIIVTGTEST